MCGWPPVDWPVRLIPCSLEKRRWPHNNCQSRTSWSTKTLSTPSSSGSPSPKQHRQRFRSLDLRECWANLHDGATAPGRLPQMSYGRGRKRRRGSHRQSGTGAVCGSAAERKNAQWAQCHRCGDPGHFIGRFCPVKEVEPLIPRPGYPTCCPRSKLGLYQIPVIIKGRTYPALVDSGL